MSATATLVTVEQFLKLPETPGVRRELIEGIIVEMGTALSDHEVVKSNTHELLVEWRLRTGLGKVFSETTFVLSDYGAPIPAVAWLSSERLQLRQPGRHFQGAPDLAVEVVSSETAVQLEAKVDAYLRHGSRAVWVAYPEQRVARVHRPDRTSRLLQGEETLEDPELLPGFRVPLSRVFDGL